MEIKIKFKSGKEIALTVEELNELQLLNFMNTRIESIPYTQDSSIVTPPYIVTCSDYTPSESLSELLNKPEETI